jgi:hypothetical protein
MALIEINKNPSRKDLTVFGVLLLLFVGIVGSLLRFKWDAPAAATAAWACGALLVAAYFAIRPMQRPLYLGWMYAAMPIGMTVSFLLLAIIYYLVFTPIGLLLRLFGHDSMHPTFDRAAPTYWHEHRTGGDVQRYFRQF